MKRRTFVSGSAALAAASVVTPAFAASVKPYSWDLNPPTDTRDNFIAWGKSRGEDPYFLGQRWDRFQALVKNKDLWGAATIRAFLLTPREEFAAINPAIHKRAYEHAFLDIGYGVTMSGPHIQGRMTNVIDVKRGEKVERLATIRIVDVRREPLWCITSDDVLREGFPLMTRREFITMFCEHNRGCTIPRT